MTRISSALRLLAPDELERTAAEVRWQDVCALEDIWPDTGACALIGGRQVAIVRVGPGETLYALDNFDPFSKAFVLSRGIVGDRGGVPTIASPIYKQKFDLRTGQSFDDPAVKVAIFAVRVRGGRVEIAQPAGAGGLP